MELSELFVKKQKKWNNKYFGKHNFKKIFSPYLNKNGKHLDFGCGFGNFCYFLAKDYPELEVFGIDKKENQIKYGKENFQLNNIHLSSNPELPEELDSISLITVLHELKDQQNQLTLFYEALKENGFILIYDFRRVSEEEFKEWYDKKKVIGEYQNSFEEEYTLHNKWNPKRFSEFMESIGFEEVILKNAGKFWFWYIGKKIIS